MGRSAVAAAASTLAFLLVPVSADAAGPGDLDPTFSGDGYSLIDLGENHEEAMAVAPAAGGKLIAGGIVVRNTPYQRTAFLVRLNLDGGIDVSFGSGGSTIYAAPCSGYDPIRSVSVLPDGKILTAGGCNGDFILMRFNADGGLDQSFDGDPGNPGGGNGVVMTAFPEPANAYNMVVDPAGAITLAGDCCTGEPPQYQNTTLARYAADGTLDKGFDGPPVNPAGGNGKVVYPLDLTFDDRAEDLVDAGGGRVAFTGARNGVTYVALIDSTGKLVSSFSGNGVAEIDHHAENDRGAAIAVDASGRLLVASEVGPVLNTEIVLARIDTSGIVDPSFGLPALTRSPGIGDLPTALKVDAAGRVLVVGVGSTEIGPGSFTYGRAIAARFLADGQPDQSFGPGGERLFAGPQGLATGVAAALDESGRLLVSGVSSPLAEASPPKNPALVARILTEPEATLPSNDFKFVGLKRNKRKGTATLIVSLPGPGKLKLAKSGKLKAYSTSAKKAGRVRIPIKPRGKARRRLASRANQGRTARVKVTAKVTFTPTGGTAKTKSKKLTLLRRG